MFFLFKKKSKDRTIDSVKNRMEKFNYSVTPWPQMHTNNNTSKEKKD